MNRQADFQTGHPPDGEIEHPWITRGYRHDLATSRRSPNEDPKGELAYQRAFHEYDKLNPPRVPNPSYYPNSPSAQAYIMRKDDELFSVGKPIPQSATSASPSAPVSQPETQERNHPTEKENSNLPPRRDDSHHKIDVESYRPPTSTQPQYSATVVQSIGDQRPPSDRPPMTLEPKLDAPTGPTRMLR